LFVYRHKASNFIMIFDDVLFVKGTGSPDGLSYGCNV
jgi:hypothetical protein